MLSSPSDGREVGNSSKPNLDSNELSLDLHEVCYYVTNGSHTKHLLSNVNLHLGAGQMSALMGPSGAGCVYEYSKPIDRM